jgi:hypothetical protein
MVKIVRIRQAKQARNSESYDDQKPNGPVMEADPALDNLEADLNNLRSQLRRVIDTTGNWYDDPQTDLVELVKLAARRHDQALLGPINGVNTVFTTAAKFRHDGTKNEHVFYNGVKLQEGVGCDYVASESVPTTGYDTITLAFVPLSGDQLTIDFTPV